MQRGHLYPVELKLAEAPRVGDVPADRRVAAAGYLFGYVSVAGVGRWVEAGVIEEAVGRPVAEDADRVALLRGAQHDGEQHRRGSRVPSQSSSFLAQVVCG